VRWEDRYRNEQKNWDGYFGMDKAGLDHKKYHYIIKYFDRVDQSHKLRSMGVLITFPTEGKGLLVSNYPAILVFGFWQRMARTIRER